MKRKIIASLLTLATVGSLSACSFPAAVTSNAIPESESMKTSALEEEVSETADKTEAIEISVPSESEQSTESETDSESLTTEQTDHAQLFVEGYMKSICLLELPALNGGTCNFTYDEKYHRIGKECSGSTIEYQYYDDGWLKQIIIDDSDIITVEYKNGRRLFVSSIELNGERFDLNYDAEDNVESISQNGIEILKYDYSSDYGGVIHYTAENLSSLSENAQRVGELNPFRYRGFMYEKETGYYYTGTQYFKPGTSEFERLKQF